MTDKEKRQQRRSAEDATFNRMLLCLVGAIAAEAIILFVKRFYIDITAGGADIAIATGLMYFFRVFVYAGLVLTAAGIVWCVFSARNHKKLRLPVVCTTVVCFLWVLSVLAYFFNDVGVKALMALPAVAAVLILIYFLYQRAFFVNAILTGCGMAALWGYRQFHAAHSTAVTVAFVVGWVGLVAIAFVVYLLKKSGGKLGKLQLVSDQKCYPVCWLTCAVIFAATLLGFLLGAGLAYYLIYVLIGWLFCLAVYYTVKLM